jgi:hypothetical protein
MDSLSLELVFVPNSFYLNIWLILDLKEFRVLVIFVAVQAMAISDMFV